MRRKKHVWFWIFVVALSFLSILPIPVRASPDYEDFTDPSWVEVDPNSHISVASATHIDGTVNRNEDAYLYNDKGVDHFGDFEHDIDVRINTGASDYSVVVAYGVANEIDDRQDWTTGISVQFHWNFPADVIYLVEMSGGLLKGLDSYSDFLIDTWYYLTIEKDGLVLTCKIYNDSERTSLIDTLYITLQADHKLRYVYGICTDNQGADAPTNCDIENLDLKEVITRYVTFYYNTGGSLRVDNATTANGTENSYGNGTVIELLAVVEGNLTYGFSNFTWDSSSSACNPYNLTVPSNLTVWCYFEVVYVDINPTAKFTFEPSNPVPNSTIVFNASTTIDVDGNITQYCWDFGDGNTSCGQEFFSTQSDSFIFKSHANYATAHDATSGTVQYTSYEFLVVGQDYSIMSGKYLIVRLALHFDTSSIPDSYDIESAALGLYGRTDESDTNFDIVIQNGQPTYPHEPVQSGDYNKNHYSGDGGSFNTIFFTTSGYNNISLNSDGLSWINKTGTTKFLLRSRRDIDTTTPTGSERVFVWANEQGAPFQPRLFINAFSVSHTYLSTGNYNVTLTVTDNDGLTDSFTQIVCVEAVFASGMILGITSATIFLIIAFVVLIVGLTKR